jgi:hypothetical protein
MIIFTVFIFLSHYCLIFFLKSSFQVQVFAQNITSTGHLEFSNAKATVT